MTKLTKWHVREKTQISLGIRPVWSESSLSAWRKLGSLVTHEAHSEDSDQSSWSESSLGAQSILLILTCCGSKSMCMFNDWYAKGHGWLQGMLDHINGHF